MDGFSVTGDRILSPVISGGQRPINNNRRQDTILPYIEQFRTLCGEAALCHFAQLYIRGGTGFSLWITYLSFNRFRRRLPALLIPVHDLALAVRLHRQV